MSRLGRASLHVYLFALACVLSSGGASLNAQDAAAVRDMLRPRVGDLSLLRVPDNVADFPQPRLPGGAPDPRFAITPEKVRLGKLLFFDPIRSNHIRPEYGGVMATSQTGSCGSCHIGEAATKAGVVVSVSVGGQGRHSMNRVGEVFIEREIMPGLEDILPTGIELADGDGNILASGLFDAIDAPGRVAPSVIGFAFNQRLLWAGEAGEPNELGYPAQEDVVLIASRAHRMANPDSSHLQAIAAYRVLFADAFPDEAAAADASGDLDELINVDTQVRAIAAFLRTVITRNTPWDRFLDGDDRALTDRQLRGAWLFAAPVDAGGANCIACHGGPALNKVLGDERGELVEENFHNLGTLEHPLQDLARATLGPDHRDGGRAAVTGDPADAWEFKTPTLRQLRDAAPYFHGGEAATLREAVEYHLDGVPANPLAAAAGTLSPLFADPHGDGRGGIVLDEADLESLLDFLEHGLHDRSLVHSDSGSPTELFELILNDLTYSDRLRTAGAVDGWLPSGLPNGFADPLSREQLVFIRGDTGNGDHDVDIADAITIVSYLFLGERAPYPMMSGDVNDDSAVDVADAIYLIGFLFLGREAPPAPYPEPGQDLTR